MIITSSSTSRRSSSSMFAISLGILFIKGGCSRRGVQWMGVVLYNKTPCNIM